MISLVMLPMLFFLSTIEIRKKSISYGLIEVNCIPDDATDRGMIAGPPESLYVFIGEDEISKLINFEQFCQHNKQVSRTILKVNLPKNCSYNFFIQTIDILNRNKFVSGVERGIIRFQYRPEMNFQPEYEPASFVEEVQYFYSKLSQLCNTIKGYFTGDQIHYVRVLTYTDLGPPPDLYGRFQFNSTFQFGINSKIKEEPKSSFYFCTLDIWFIPIIFIWFLLSILSIRKNKKLLPNQALKLTE